MKCTGPSHLRVTELSTTGRYSTDPAHDQRARGIRATVRDMVTFRVLACALALMFLVAPGRSAVGATAVPVALPAALPAEGGAPDGGRAWPLGSRPAVERGWQPPASAYGPGHRGVDLAAPAGATVRAAAAGRVSFTGRVAGRGVLSLTLPGTGDPALRTTYEPVEPLVEKGELVVAGQPVATLAAGPWHCATGCLHWGLRRGRTYLNPLSLLPAELLRRRPSRLLPVLGVPEPDPTPTPTPAPAPAPALVPPGRYGAWPGQPRTPRSAMDTAASTISGGTSAAPSSIRRTAASTMPWRSIAASRGCSWPRSARASTIMAIRPP